MDLTLVFALIVTTALLVAIPGPNVALVVANTISYGMRFGVATVVGTTIGVAMQLGFVVLGLAALLEFAASAFVWLKWAGVAYLLYLGVDALRKDVAEMDQAEPTEMPLKILFWQGALLALVNPKTLIFNAAFLPQFVPLSAGSETLLFAASIYLAVIFLGDLAWAGGAQFARPALLRAGRLRHRLTGSLYIGSGIGLALAKIER